MCRNAWDLEEKPKPISFRILSLPEDIQTILSENKLTERHARALLKIEDDDVRRNVIEKIIKNGLNVTQSEKLINDMIEKQHSSAATKERISFISYKLYVNTIRKAFACVSEVEKDAQFFQEDKDDHVELRIVIPKKSSVGVANKAINN